MDALSWQDYQLARQHLAEERIGVPARQMAAREDAAFSAARQAIDTR